MYHDTNERSPRSRRWLWPATGLLALLLVLGACGDDSGLADVADHFLVIAWTDQEKKKKRDHSGLSAFIVERGFAEATEVGKRALASFEEGEFVQAATGVRHAQH